MTTIHSAIFSNLEYNDLLNEYKAQAELLEKIKRQIGPKVEISLKNIIGFEKNLPKKLLNKIYKKAYQININHLSSIFIQFQTINNLPRHETNKVLEIGKGKGILGALLKNQEYEYKSFDIDTNLKPDFIGDVTNMNEIKNESFDLVCAFQVLEHMIYEKFFLAIKEMSRISKNFVFISIPCELNSFNLSMKLSLKARIIHRLSCNFNLLIRLPNFFIKDINIEKLIERDDKINPHYWEVGRPSYPKKKILKVIKKSNLEIIKCFHNKQFAYHWFILCKKVNAK